jgi:hypothetical protein
MVLMPLPPPLLLLLLVLAAAACHGAHGQVSPDPQWTTVEVYHINPAQYGAAPINMNTGDVLGDMYFDLRSKALSIECSDAKNAARNAHTCANAEVASPDLVMTALELAVQTPFGAYGRCNICVNHTDHHGNNSCTNGVYDCTGCGDCESVGRWNITQIFGQRKCGEGEPNYMCWHENAGRKTGGMWYSTTSVGYNVTWKVSKVHKRISKACHDNVLNERVEQANAAIFHKAGCKIGSARNTTDPRWITAFYNATLGPGAGLPGGAITGMPLSELVAAWTAPFRSTDPAAGGCPSLPIPPPGA